MVRVRVTSHAPSFLHGDESHAAGEAFDADERLLGDFPLSLERADDEADESDESDPEPEPKTEGSDGEDADTPPFDPAQFPVNELRAELSGDESDAEREALADAERAGKNRESALDILAP